MKVYDIIVEAPSNAAAYLAVLRTITNATEIDKALAYLARLVKGSRFTADEIADSWVASANKVGLTLEEIVVMGHRELRAAGVDDALIKKALQKADAVEPGIFAKVTARIKAETIPTGNWLGKSLETVTKYANALGISVPILLCIKNIGLEYADYQQSEKTPADYEQFQNSAQHWINKCVGEVAVLITGNFLIARIFSIPGGWPGFTGAKQLGPIYLGLTRAAQITFMTALMSPPGREWLARMFVADTFNLPVAVGGRIEQQPVQKVIRDTVGGWTTSALGWVADQAQKITDPAGAAKKAADATAKTAADPAAADAKYQGFSKGYKYDAYGMPIR